MTEVRVTFLVEADDPDHDLGLTDHTYSRVEESVAEMGGYNTEFEKLTPGTRPVRHGGGPKRGASQD